MIIGPGEPRKPEKPPKDAKRPKAKKRRPAEPEAPRTTDVAAEPEAPQTTAVAAVDEGPRTEAPGPERPAPSIASVGAATSPDVVAPEAPLTARIDVLRSRVDDLLALVDAASANDSVPSPAAGLDPASRPTLDSASPIALGPEHHRPSAPASVREPRPAEPPVASPSSAVLVARELLAGGMPADGVRARLRDAYGVADPEAVLAGAAAR